MALKRRTEKPEGTGDYDRLEDGEYEARLVYVADLGMQAGAIYQGEQKPDAQQIALGFEIVGHPVTISGQEVPRLMWLNPFNIFATLTAKGKELVYYSVFDKKGKEGEVADWEAQLGKPCTVTVGRSGKDCTGEYDEIKSVDPIPLKYQEDVMANDITPAVGDADDPTNPATMALHGLAKWVFARRLDGAGSDL